MTKFKGVFMLLEEIKSRRSVRAYSDKPVSDEVINEIVEAGRLAPSWVNVQPWKFIIIRDEATKELLYRASGEQKQVLAAQAIIACIADMSAWENKNFGKVIEQNERQAAAKDFILNSSFLNPSLLGDNECLIRTVEQLTYAVAYMTLQAEKSGVGCCILGAFANELTKGGADVIGELKSRLNLNDKQILLTILTVGYDKYPDSVAKKLRKPETEVVFREKLS